MSVENGEWVMHGLAWDDPYRIRSPKEFVNWIKEAGFLPLFGNGVKGFSVEEQERRGVRHGSFRFAAAGGYMGI